MSKILKDPIAVKRRDDITQKEWAFNAPPYDNRTSCSISAGNYYGVGHTNPVGKEAAGSLKSGPIPQEARCFSPDEVIYGKDQKG